MRKKVFPELNIPAADKDGETKDSMEDQIARKDALAKKLEEMEKTPLNGEWLWATVPSDFKGTRHQWAAFIEEKRKFEARTHLGGKLDYYSSNISHPAITKTTK